MAWLEHLAWFTCSDGVKRHWGWCQTRTQCLGMSLGSFYSSVAIMEASQFYKAEHSSVGIHFSHSSSLSYCLKSSVILSPASVDVSARDCTVLGVTTLWKCSSHSSTYHLPYLDGWKGNMTKNWNAELTSCSPCRWELVWFYLSRCSLGLSTTSNI